MVGALALPGIISGIKAVYRVQNERCECSAWRETLGYQVVNRWGDWRPHVKITSKAEDEALQKYRKPHPDVDLGEIYTGRKIEW